jgi:hypothetical protein
LPYSGGVGAGSLAGLDEDYLHTVEALQLYLSRLVPGGHLSITRPADVPPRDGLKLVATARAALEANGLRNAADRLLVIRSWQAVTLLVRNGAVGAEEIRRAREFCDAYAFDVAWYPGMPRSLANVHNQLAEPWYHDGARALLGADRERFLAEYPFDLRPATDDRPFFRNYFRAATFYEAWRTRERGGMALIETGYPILVATVVQALVVGAALVLAPLLVLRRRSGPVRGAARVFAFFAAIGLAFLFIEVSFVQKLMRIVHHPTVALALVLSTFLVAAGIGSAWTARSPAARARRRHLAAAVAGIVVLTLLYSAVFDPVFERVVHWPTAARLAVAAIAIAPLAFLMGMPFPLALRSLAPPLVPWAWGINGCASVVSPALATLLAIDIGFNAVLWLAAALYAATPFVIRRLQ